MELVMSAPKNMLLASLPAHDFEQISAKMEFVPLKARRVLHHSRMPMDHIYFIEEGLVSVVANTGDRLGVEVWLIGCEGMVGIPVALGSAISPHRRVVHVGGSAFRMASSDLRYAMEEMTSFRNLMLRYIQVVLIQTSQSGACSSTHSVKQRLARWILMATEHTPDYLPLTHEMLARMLGVRRATVTECLGVLEHDGALMTSRGQIKICDRERLQSLSCGCYQIMRAEQERLFREFPVSSSGWFGNTAVANTMSLDLSHVPDR
jgi:CRP-like cAMP-binding protein